MRERLLLRIAKLRRGQGRLSTSVDAVLYALKRASAALISDRAYSQIYTKVQLGRWLQLEGPLAFNDKIQWLKLYWRSPNLAEIVDKYSVRHYIAERVGCDVLIPLYGVYDSPEEIRWNELPDSFVLKPTHGSGWVIICQDKHSFDKSEAVRNLRRWMRRNYYYHSREWPYKCVKPRVICEQLLLAPDASPPSDYKIFCFNGVPRFVQVDIGRFSDHRRNFYDARWNPLDLELRYPRSEQELPRPAELSRMFELARSLSQGFPFLRVDLYVLESKIYVGELTLYPESGVGRFNPEDADRMFGEELELPPVPPQL